MLQARGVARYVSHYTRWPVFLYDETLMDALCFDLTQQHVAVGMCL